ncbi:MAG TPA: Dna2/Cas4 domain-containing protein [Methanobacteriales archaeon]|nr:Dna2/Cas4 domain-containing protein [Methanobacteriales archaeon]
MTIQVSFISEYLFCPFKVYFMGETDLENIQRNRLFREAYNNFRDFVRDLLPLINKEMGVSEIEDLLRKEIGRLPVTSEIKNLLEMEAKIESVKIKRLMDVTGKNGGDIIEFITIPSLNDYRIHDDDLELSGNIHRIEIIKGKYHPVKIKVGLPPFRGVWDSDALEIAAYALLIEKEFNSEVLLGFVDYMIVGERRPVTIDYTLRENLLSILEEIKGVLSGDTPSTKPNPRKCKKCNYNNICPDNL